MKQSKMWGMVVLVLSVLLTQVVVSTSFAQPKAKVTAKQRFNNSQGVLNVTLEGNQMGANLGQNIAPAGDINGDGYGDIILTAPLFDNGQTNEGAAFVYHGSPAGVVIPPVVMLEMNQAGAEMGGAAAGGDINGDGYADILVGAPLYSNGQSNEGAVFVYHGSPAGVTITPNQTLEVNQASGRFGHSLAFVGDVNGDGYGDVLVGATLYDNGQTNEGAAFVYYGSVTGLNPTPTILEMNQAAAELGHAVAGLGDVNGDGYADVAISSRLFDNGQTDEGAVFVYYGSGSGISTTPSLTLEQNQASAGFGQAVSTAGDVNGDGYSDVLVGANLYDNGQTDEGAVFVYHGSAGGLGGSPAVTLERNQANAQFGFSVAGLADINGDGYSDIVAGASVFANGQAAEGATFVYYGSATGIPTTPAVTAESNQANAGLGSAVAPAGDVNGDGYSDYLTSAPLFDNGETDEGQVFLTYGTAVGLSTQHGWVYEGAASPSYRLGADVAGIGDVNGDGYADFAVSRDVNNVFIFHGSATGFSASPALNIAHTGFRISGAGDLNGDGYDDFAMGDFTYDDGQTDEGAVFVYYGSPTGLTLASEVNLQINIANAEFGRDVARAGDVNGDGFADLAVGVRSLNGTGAIMLYYGSPTGIPTTPSQTLGSPQTSSFLGISVNGAGDINGDGFADIVGGANGYDNGQTDEGALFVYYGSASGVVITPTILQSNLAAARMGATVASGDVNGDGYSDIFTGGIGYSNGQTGEGAVWVFHGSSTGIATTPSLILEGNQTDANFGFSVSPAGDVNGDGFNDVLIGARYYMVSFDDEGRVFLYYGSPTGLNATPALQLAKPVSTNVQFGSGVAGLGDANGDGLADIAIGAWGWSNPTTSQGAVFVYYGNQNRRGRSALREQRTWDSSQRVSPWGSPQSFEQFVVEQQITSPTGRVQAKLQVEVCPTGIPFGDATCTIYTSPTWQDVTATSSGITLTLPITNLEDYTLYRWRSRALYIPYTSTAAGITPPPNPSHTPWQRPTSQAHEADIRTAPRPEVEIAKTATPTTALPGEPITYTLTFTNSGTGIANNVVITDLIPTELVSVTYQSSGAVITSTGATNFVWLVEDLLPSAGGQITVTGWLTVPLPAGWVITNTAVITGTDDEMSENNQATAVITIENALLVAEDDLFTVPEDSLNNSLSVLANDTDDNEDTLFISALGTPNNGGTVNINGTTVDYSPAADFFGTEVFTYTAGDGQGGFATATVTVTVTPVNDTPTAGDDLFTVPEDSLNNLLAVLVNDSDEESAVSLVGLGTPNNGGTVNISGPEVEYSPAANFFGTEVFTYTAGDGQGGFATATVTVTVTPVNDDPTAQDDIYMVLEDSVNNSLSVLTNDTIAPDSGETLALTSLGTPDNGGTVNINGMAVDYTPAADFFGTEVFTYTAGDGHGGFATATVTVTVTPINDTPMAGDDLFTVPEDSLNNLLAVLVNDSDEESAVSLVGLGIPNNGGVVNISGPEVEYSPAANFFGTEVFTYTAGDGNGGFATATVTVTVTPVNDHPQSLDDSYVVAQASVNNLFNVLANDTIAPDSGETLTLTQIGTLNQGGTAVISSNQVAYTPVPAFTGQEVFTYTVSDGNGGQATATVTVTVVADQAPYFVSTPITTAQTNVVYSYEVVTDDPDVTDTLTITAELLPNWLTLTDFGDRTGELTGTPPAAGEYPVTLVVSDGILSAPQQFTITVEGGITATHRLFLPLIMRPYAFQLGEAYPAEPVTEQGVIYYANTVALPPELPTGGQFYLSSTSSGLGRVIVDDRLTLTVGGQLIFTQGFGQPPAGLIVPLARSVVEQMAGQEVTIYYQDVFGDQQAATAVWLIWMP